MAKFISPGAKGHVIATEFPSVLVRNFSENFQGQWNVRSYINPKYIMHDFRVLLQICIIVFLEPLVGTR